MNLSYALRLLCVSFASLFLVLVALSALLEVFGRTAIRVAGRAKLRTGLRTLFALRLAPACAGLLVVLVLCVPSYLWLEPEATHEHVGLACCIAAALGVGLCMEAMVRVGRAIYETRRFERESLAAGHLLAVGTDSAPAIVLNSDTPVLTLAGVFRPRVIASRAVVDGLSRDELDAALSHELAHDSARDNIRRLLFLAAPRIPFLRATGELERTWNRWSEWAADDHAAASDPGKSLSLASALVHMARLGLRRPATALCANFASAKSDLEQRVDRLLREDRSDESETPRKRNVFTVAAMAISAVLLAVALVQPSTLHSVHEVLERLIH